MQSMDNCMSREQLWDQLYSDMQSRGVIESLRTQMRKKLLQNLALVKAESNVVKLVNVDVPDQRALQTIHALIVDHLRLCGFEFSLSLFLPESGVASVDNARHSLRTSLGKQAEDALVSRLEDSAENSLLLKLFEPMMRHSGVRTTGSSKRLVDADVQTDAVHYDLAEDLNSEDDGKFDEKNSFQRRFFLLKKSVEERKRMEIASEMQRFKENEFKAAELDSARKAEGERDKMRIEFEEKYKQRNAHLDAKEREMEKQLKRKAEETEREMSNQRNVLIDELQRSKIKEDNLRSRETDLERKGEEAEKRLSNLREILDQREKLIKHRESELDEKVRAEVRGILSTAEEEREERLKLLRKEEERVNDLKEILEKKKKGEDSREEEEEATILRLKHLTSQYKVEKEAREELEEEVAKMRRKMEAVDSLENLQMQNEALRRDLEEIMFRERDSRDQLEAERSTLRDMKLHLTSCSPEIIVNLKREAESLQNLVERQNANHNREMEEHGQRAQDLKNVNRQMRDAVQSKTEEMESLYRVVEDLQLQLRYSQEALRIMKLTGPNPHCESVGRQDFVDSSQEEPSESTPKSTPSSKRQQDRSTRASAHVSRPSKISNTQLQQPPSYVDTQIRFSDHPDTDKDSANRGRLRDLIGQAEELHSTFRRISEKPTEISLVTGHQLPTSRNRRKALIEGKESSGQQCRDRADRGRESDDVRQFLDNLRPSGRGTASDAAPMVHRKSLLDYSAMQFGSSGRELPNQPPVDDQSIDALVNARLSAILGPRQTLDNDNFTSTPSRHGMPTSVSREARPGREVADDVLLSQISKPSSLEQQQQRSHAVRSPPIERNLNLSDYEKERSIREDQSDGRNRDSEMDTDVEEVGVANDTSAFNRDHDDEDIGGGERERDEFGTLMEQQLEGTTLNESTLPSQQQQQQQQHFLRGISQDLNHSERQIRVNEPTIDVPSNNHRLQREVNQAIDTMNESLDVSKLRPLEESTMTMRNETLTHTMNGGTRIQLEDSNLPMGNTLEETMPADDTIQEFNRIPKLSIPKQLSSSESSSVSLNAAGIAPVPAPLDDSRPALSRPELISSPDQGGNVSPPRSISNKTGNLKEDSESSYSGGEGGNAGAQSAHSSGSISHPRLIRDRISPRSGRSSSSHSRSSGHRTGQKNQRASPTSPRSLISDKKDSDKNNSAASDGMNSELLKYVENAKRERERQKAEGNPDSDLSLADTSSEKFKHDLSKGSDVDW